MNNLSRRQLDALDRIKQKPALQPFFFKNLKGLKWFDELENREFFKPEHHSGPVPSDQEGYYSIPAWPVLDYLEQTAPELQQSENLNHVAKFLHVMREITRSAMADQVYNFRTWLCFATILRFIPIEKVTREDAEHMEYWLNDPYDHMLIGTELGDHFLRRLLVKDSTHAQDLAIRLVRALTAITWNSTQYGTSEKLEAVLLVKPYHLRETLGTHGRTIGEKLGDRGVDIFRDRISEMLEKSDKDKYSSIWRPAIEDHKQNSDTVNEAEDILVSALRDSLLGYVERRATAATGYVRKLLSSDTVLFKRVAIYAINVYNQELGNLVHKLVDSQYFKYHYQHEMYHMLDKCFSEFSEEKKQKTLRIIRRIAEEWKDPKQSEDIQTKQQAYACLIWLSAVQGKDYKQADDLYAENIAIVGKEPEHPDFSSYIEDGGCIVGEVSPYSAGELVSRDVNDLFDMLRSFKEDCTWDAPSRRGLAQTLKEAIKAKPEFFKNNLAEFLDLHYVYTSHMIMAYREVWTEKQHDNWEELLNFCWTLLQSDGFWSKDASKQREDTDYSRRWVVGQISELIKEGTSNDKLAFDPSLFQTTKKIIERILEKQEGESFRDVTDSVTLAINNPRGKCIESLINYALRRCRLAEKKSDNGHDELWEMELKPIFDKQIAIVQDGNYEFATLFSFYLPNLLYLSQSWTIEQLPKIFNKDNRIRWICAAQGYAYTNRLYTVVYEFLRLNNHLKDILDAGELESRYKDKVIQQFVIAYFRNDGKQDDFTEELHWLLTRWKHEEIRQLIWFIWANYNDKEDVKIKLIPLWKKISERAKLQQETDKRVLSYLCKWSVFVDQPNKQIMELLLRSAPYADMEHNAYILIRELKRLVDSHPDQVAEIFIHLLEVSAPTYEQGDIKYVISKLYEAGGENRQKANTICDKYICYGIGFPAEIRDANTHSVPNIE